jgi:hypothetical protein
MRHLKNLVTKFGKARRDRSHQSSHRSSFKNSLRLETLESRQLLAADLLFFDSFEVSEWNGQWVEDSQNDWFRSTQRATDGSRSAEVDGFANNATLTLANSLDLSGYSTAELTFSWYIESSWDTGEYIAIDVFNGSWQEVDRLRGNVDAENTWHHETVSLDNYLSAGFLLRFRASVSDSAEDGNVDNVKIVGTPAGPPQISISDATATEGDLSSYRFVDAFVTSQSGGLLNSQNSTIGPDGNLYVSSAGTNSVLKYDGTSGAFIQEFVSPGSGGLDDPRDLLFDTNGDLLVSSRNTNTVIRYDGQTGHFDSVLVSGGGLNIPQHMAYNELTNELFVSSAQSDEVYKYNGLTGELLGVFVTAGSGGLSNPKGLALTETGGLLVVSQLGDQILEYNALGTFERIFYSVPAAEASTAILTDMVWGLDGNLLVTENNDLHGGRVIRLNAGTGALMDVVVEPIGGGLDEVRGITIDDDGNIYVASFDSHEILRYAPASNAAFNVSLSSATDTPVTIDFSSFGGSATINDDFLSVVGTLTFEPGVTSRTIIVPTIDDTEFEETETFFVNLANPVGATLLDNQAEGTIVDNEALVTISYPDFSDPTGLNLIRDAAIANGNTLRLTPAASGKEGAAWYSAEKQFVALPWETSFDFNLNENSSDSFGGSDGFTFAIQNFDPTYLAGGGSHLGYTSLANSLVVEFDTFQSLGDPSDSHISVHTNGTGPNGWEHSLSLGSFNTSTPLDDATTHTAKIRYTNGELSVFVDDLVNPVLVVPVDLASLLDLDQGRAWVGFTATTGGGYQNHDILNWNHRVFADSSTTVAVSDAALIEGSSGVSQMVFDITRLGDTSGITTVDWATSDATATSGIDYTAASGSVSFAPGETLKTVSVAIYGDSVDEAHETLFVTLMNPVGGSIADATGIGTILNDDSTISISDATATEGDPSYRFIDDFVAARGGMIATPMGVAFGPDGNLYVGHHGLGVVKRFNGLTGQFMGVFADGSDVAEEVSQVLFHDGYLFAATGTVGIMRFDAGTGEPAPAVGKPGAQFATPADQGLLVGVHSFAFGPDGHLYLTGSSSNQILRYNGASGEFLDTFVVADGNSARITFGTDGHLYSGVNNAVMRYQGPLEANPGAFIDTFVSSENMGISPIPTGGLKFGPSGDLFVVRRDTNTVLRFDGATGAFRETVVEPGEGGVTSPRGIAFDSQGRLYVASGISHEILRYGPTLEAAFTISLSNPSAMAVDVMYSTANGSAQAGSDYVSTSGTITFLPGQTTRTIFVQTIDDAVSEGNETFIVNLFAAAGAAITDDQGVATIIDNDVPSTKFYVVDDGSPDRTYEYGASGVAVENYSLGSGNTAPRGAASNLAGDKVWVVDANKKVYVYNDAGGLLGSWSAGSLASNATVEGIATNGTDVWIVDAGQDRVYRYANAASRLSGSRNAASSFALNSGNLSPKDIVTDGTYLWVVEDSTTDKVFKYTLSGSLVGSWTINAGGGSPTGITLDPSGASQSLWIVDSASDRVYEYANARATHSGSLSAAVSFALAAGNTNPQGIADPPAPVSVPTQSKASGVGSSAQLPSSRSFSPIVSSGVPAIEPNRSASELNRSREMVRTLLEELPTASLATSRQSNLSEFVTQSVRSESSASAESKMTSQDSADLAFTGDAFEWLDDALLGMLAHSR